jgi:hypothetical protein
MSSVKSIKWKFGILASITVVIVTAIPQALLWKDRGKQWNGSFASVDKDELAYSAYLNSVIAGRPRLNNPYLGETNGAVTKENLFSVQFLPPYVLALTAKLLGLSSSGVFILASPMCAFAASMVIFWLFSNLTGDGRTSATASLLVLFCGLMLSENPLAGQKLFYTFAFLRRYIPAVPFPFFFLFIGCIWRAFTVHSRRSIFWLLAGVTAFTILVYSYFYLWTAACVWFGTLALLWFLLRPADARHLAICLGIMVPLMVLVLIPYLYILSHRSGTTDVTQGLLLTHIPDLFRFTEILGTLIIAILAWRARKDLPDSCSPAVVLTASCALTPLIVFNQQIITGYSLQPFHYDQFITNYLVLVGALLMLQLIWQGIGKFYIYWIALALGVGIATGVKSYSVEAQANQLRDESKPLYQRIDQYSKGGSNGYALFDTETLSKDAATNSSVALLWSPFMYTFGNTSSYEERERFYQFLYFLGTDRAHFESVIMRQPLYLATIFGHVRVYKVLSLKFNPISEREIVDEAESYEAYVKNFSQQQASRWPLSFLILSEQKNVDLSNLSRWYNIAGQEQIGSSTLYRLHLKEPKTATPEIAGPQSRNSFVTNEPRVRRR